MIQNYDGIDIKNKYYKIIEPNENQQKYVNKTFHKLTAITPVIILGKNTKNYRDINAQWLFKCSCGNKICRALRTAINNQTTIDCGCGKKQYYANKYIGKTYNYLTVISLDEDYKKENNIKSANAYYKCKCKCGNYKTVRITTLVAGEVKSCGCLKKEQEKENLIHGITLIDLTGQKFGLLTVLERDDAIEDGKRDARWKCKCECGNIKTIRSSNLRNGTTTSCGCLKESYGEYKIKKILKENQINFIHNEPYFKDLITSRGGIGRYDFIILDINNNPIRLIEFDGEQHYKSIDYFGGEEKFKMQQINDEIKNNYAKNHNLPLIRIPYYSIQEITYENLFNDKFIFKE